VSLVANYVSMSGLLAAITEGLTGSGLVAQDNGGTVLITESASPFAGGAITSSSLPAAVFGDAPVYTSGTASTGGSPAVTANVTLAYNSATGTAFPACRRGCNGFHLLTAGMSTGLSQLTARRRRWRAWLMVPLMSHGRDSPPGR
jgi:hypothetical protein